MKQRLLEVWPDEASQFLLQTLDGALETSSEECFMTHTSSYDLFCPTCRKTHNSLGSASNVFIY